MAAVSLDGQVKSTPGKQIDKLSKDSAAIVHPAIVAQADRQILPVFEKAISNRVP